MKIAKAQQVEWKRRKDEEKAKKKEARANMKHTFDPGTILYASWGYDQTNVDFYQVTARTDKTVTFREIAGEHVPGSGESNGMSANVRPLKDQFLDGKPEHRRTVGVSIHRDGEAHYYVSFGKLFHLSPYTNGERGTYCSWYA